MAAFPDVTFGDTDLSHQKYLRVKDPRELSAWHEFLRNGPRFAIQHSSGVTGYFSRYSIEFMLPDPPDAGEVEKVRLFLAGLKPRGVQISEYA